VELTSKDVERYIAKTRPREAGAVLSALNRSKKFMDAIRSDVGRELLEEVSKELQRLFDLIVDEKAEPKDLATFRAYRHIGLAWGKKIAEYRKLTERVKK